jgi:outer membrane protein OmpA-like peptidoglycan-associated protein
MRVKFPGAASSIALCMLAFMASPASSLTVGPFVLFYGSGSPGFDPKGQKVLDNFRGAWSQFGLGMTVVVAAHSDRAGSDVANRQLSCARARIAGAYLVSMGVPEDQILLLGWGESMPLVETADGVPERDNRRVELSYEPPGAAVGRRLDQRC